MSAGAVKAGQVYVEIGADPRAFFATINKINRQVGTIGRSISAAGSKIAGVGVGGLVPFAAAVRSGSQFENVLLSVKASTGATEEQLLAVRAAALSMSQAMATGPTEIAGAFLELLKAGMQVEDVLGGAGEAAVQFAKVGGMDIAQAGVVMADAMNVFGVDAAKAANSISSAADASSTSIELLSQSFSMVSAVAALANQTIDDTSAALAVLANNGVKGSDAGTSLKTMLLRLMAPAEDAVKAMQDIGLSTESFRTADGRVKPLVQIIGTLNDSLSGMGQAARDDVLRRIFGQDAIRAAAILTTTGVDGFNKMLDAMGNALPVGEKFKVLMSGLSGSGQAVMASLERAAVAIADAVGPALKDVGRGIVEVVNGLTVFIGNNRELVVSLAKSLVAAVGVGTAMTGLGLSLQMASYGMDGLFKAVSLMASPLMLAAKTAAAVGGSFASAVPGVAMLATSFGKAITAAITMVASVAGAAASYVASVSAMSAATVSRLAVVGATWVASGIAVSAGFLAHIKAMVTYYTGALAGVQAITISRAGATAAAWITSTIGVDTFANATKTSLTNANRVVNATMATITPAITFIGRGFAAIASDASRLAGPIVRPFVATGKAVALFAAETASGIASYVASVSAAVIGSVTGAAQISAAWVRQAAAGIAQFAAGVASPIAAYLSAVGASVAATATAAAKIVGSWMVAAFPAISAFAAGAATSIAAYVSSTVAAAAASVANAARSGGAWVASGMPGIATFVASAVSGVATYLSAAAAAVAGSVASAAAVSAAWLAPLAPVAALGASIAGAAAIAYAFRGQIGSTFSGVTELVSEAAGVIGSSFSVAVADAAVVFNDLYATAQTTFTGIYAAVAEGDLAGAMDILWEGLQAGWIRGSAALMSYVDPWISLFQNAFTILGAEIYKTWDSLWTDVGGALNTAAAYLLGAFDNVINPLLAAWDTLEAGIRKSWNRVQSLFKGGFDLKAENDKVDSEMDARRRSRELERGGIAGRTAAAEAANAESERARQDRAAAVDANTEATIAGREAANAANATKRQQEAAAAQSGLEASVRGRRESKVQGEQFARLLDDIKKATTLDQLRDAYGEFDALSSNGRLTTIQSDTLESALEDAQERITAATMSGGGRASEIRAGAGAAGSAAAQSKSEVAGTFSSSLGGMGFGSSLGERQLDALKQIAANTANLEGPATVAP